MIQEQLVKQNTSMKSKIGSICEKIEALQSEQKHYQS